MPTHLRGQQVEFCKRNEMQPSLAHLSRSFIYAWTSMGLRASGG
jgi:hypothetical protein